MSKCRLVSPLIQEQAFRVGITTSHKLFSWFYQIISRLTISLLVRGSHSFTMLPVNMLSLEEVNYLKRIRLGLDEFGNLPRFYPIFLRCFRLVQVEGF